MGQRHVSSRACTRRDGSWMPANLFEKLAARPPKLTRGPWCALQTKHPPLFTRPPTTRWSMATTLSACYWSIVLHARPAQVLAVPRSLDLNGRFPCPPFWCSSEPSWSSGSCTCACTCTCTLKRLKRSDRGFDQEGLPHSPSVCCSPWPGAHRTSAHSLDLVQAKHWAKSRRCRAPVVHDGFTHKCPCPTSAQAWERAHLGCYGCYGCCYGCCCCSCTTTSHPPSALLKRGGVQGSTEA